MKYVIQSERLKLRRLASTDIDHLYAILSDPETMQYYPKPYSLRETKGWIERAMSSYDVNGFGLWAVILKEELTFIGQCGISLQNINGNKVPEIGYHFNKKYWKRGFASEAADACLQYGLIQLALGEIFIHTYVKNTPSAKVAERIGMIKRGVYDKKVGKFNVVMKHVIYSRKRRQEITPIYGSLDTNTKSLRTND